MLELGRPEGGEKIGRFILHHVRKSQPPTISVSSFFALLQQTELLHRQRRAPAGSPLAVVRAPTARCATAHGRMSRRCPWPPPPLLLYVRRRRPLRTELAAARGSRGSLGSRKRASSHGDDETFMACDRICACCKRVFYMLQMFHKDVASVSCGCCKSRSGCFSVAT
jgi:hypothetical protein